jgi:putative pyruvate formate lyase activating enzyme
MYIETTHSPLSHCVLCPKKCGVNRIKGEIGFCGAGATAIVAHYGLHYGEEPPISGSHGSGTVFFSPCNLRCVFCQNHQISHHTVGEMASARRLTDIFFELRQRGAHNINLVSPTPYVPFIATAIRAAMAEGFHLPFIYNTNAYETKETIKMMEGLVSIYLPDFKYWSSDVARRLSSAPRYPKVAAEAIEKMKAQVGNLVIEDGIASKGLLVRHLVLPGGLGGTKKVIKWIEEHLGVQTAISLMSQYSPVCSAHSIPLINRRIRHEEYDSIIDFVEERGFENVYIQELTSAEVLLPDFTKDRPFTK